MPSRLPVHIAQYIPDKGIKSPTARHTITDNVTCMDSGMRILTRKSPAALSSDRSISFVCIRKHTIMECPPPLLTLNVINAHHNTQKNSCYSYPLNRYVQQSNGLIILYLAALSERSNWIEWSRRDAERGAGSHTATSNCCAKDNHLHSNTTRIMTTNGNVHNGGNTLRRRQLQN